MHILERTGGWIISLNVGKYRSDLQPFTHAWTADGKFATTGPWMYFETQKDADEYVREQNHLLNLAAKMVERTETDGSRNGS